MIVHYHYLSIVSQQYNWASVSEPHTSDVNAAFPLYYHHHGTYVVLYILYSPILAYYATEFPHLLQKLRVLPPENHLTQYREMLPKLCRVWMLQKLTVLHPKRARRQFPRSSSPHNVLHSPCILAMHSKVKGSEPHPKSSARNCTKSNKNIPLAVPRMYIKSGYILFYLVA